MNKVEGGLSRYDYMRGLFRSNWAWEALRRNPEFRNDVASAHPGGVSEKTIPGLPDITFLRPRMDQSRAEKWGLCFFPDPAFDARRAVSFKTDLGGARADERGDLLANAMGSDPTLEETYTPSNVIRARKTQKKREKRQEIMRQIGTKRAPKV